MPLPPSTSKSTLVLGQGYGQLQRCARKMKGFIATLVMAAALPAYSDPDEKEFQPPITAEQAAITARRVLAKHNFSPKNFEIRSIEWELQLVPGRTLPKAGESKITETENKQLKALHEEFGNGPAWKVVFWRTKQVADTGNWYDHISFGLVVLVFEGNRAALVDMRTVKVDKVEAEAEAEQGKK